MSCNVNPVILMTLIGVNDVDSMADTLWYIFQIRDDTFDWVMYQIRIINYGYNCNMFGFSKKS